MEQEAASLVQASGALEDTFRQAVALHQQGRLADAERVYQTVLRLQPGHFGALYLLGVVALHTGRAAWAIELFDKAITLRPDHAAPYCDRGIALRHLQRPEEAVASYDKAIVLQPDFAEAFSNRGVALQAMRCPEQAVASYDQAIVLKPEWAEAHYNRGNALLELECHEAALASYDKAIVLKPDYAEAYGNRGAVLRDLARPEEAIASYDNAIALRPDYADAYNGRGLALEALKRPEAALASYDQAVALQPDHAAAHYNRGNTLHELKRPAEAVASHDKAIALKPGYAEAYYNRGLALQDLQRSADALASYDQAIALQPDFADAYNNRGMALQEMQRPEEAAASYARAIALKPDHAEAHCNQGLCLLQMGRFDLGLPQYEWRRQHDGTVVARDYRQPLWLGGTNIAGKTLFIYREQGLGDTIQFCRYAKLVAARGARVVMEVQHSLVGLLAQLGPMIRVIGPDQDPGAFDYHCPMLSLPLAFGTILETIPSEPCYLAADQHLRAQWAARLPPRARPRIGLVWRGSAGHGNDRNRSIDLATCLPLFGLDAEFVCLQRGVTTDELAMLRQAGGITSVDNELNDFSDTAALLDLMDLVITVDTSVAHLAGAMGKPVRLLLPYNPDWRWLLDRDDSPWYPSMRLFRQQRIGDWAAVIDRVRRAGWT